MAVTYVASGSFTNSANVLSWSLTLDAAIQTGDLLIIGQRESVIFSEPAGVVLLSRINEFSNTHSNIWAYVVPATVPASLTWTSGASGRCSAGYIAYRGANIPSPLTDLIWGAGAVGSLVAPSVTTTADGSLIFRTHMSTDNSVGLANAADVTNRWTSVLTTTNRQSSVGGDKAQTTAGATGTSTGVSGTPTSPRSYTVAVQPVVAAGQTINLGRPVETDIARSLTVVNPNPATVPVGRPVETDVARALVVLNPQTVTLGAASELDVAQSLAVSNPDIIPLGRAVEVDTASPLTIINPDPITVVLGRATESDAAQSLTISTAAGPDSISGLVTWLDANTLALSNGAAVTSWTSGSTGSEVFSQATAARQPTFVTPALNGLAGVSFDGGDEVVGTVGRNLKPVTMFAVVKFNSVVGPASIMAGASGSGLNWKLSSLQPSKYELAKEGVAVLGRGTTSVVASTAQIAEVSWTAAGDIDFKIDGVADGTGTSTTTLTTRAIEIGSRGAVAEAMNGVIYELLIYNAALTTAERGTVRGYLDTRWFGAQPVTVALGRAVEVDTSRPLTIISPMFVPLGRATETSTANALTVGNLNPATVALGRATETSAARPLTVANPATIQLGRPVEVDTARPLTVVAPVTVALGRATETDAAGSLTASSPDSITLGRATESDTARPLTVVTVDAVSLGRAAEVDAARALSILAPATITLGRATETDTAGSLTPRATASGTPDERTLTVAAEIRTRVVAAEDRTLTVPDDARILEVTRA